MSPATRPSRAGVSLRSAAGLRPGAADSAAVPAVLQPSAEPPAVPEVHSDPIELPRGARSARPTRITVDLVGELHSFLRGYAQARDVAAADVIRELIRQVRADPDLSVKVTAELSRRQEALAEAMRAAKE